MPREWHHHGHEFLCPCVCRRGWSAPARTCANLSHQDGLPRELSQGRPLWIALPEGETIKTLRFQHSLITLSHSTIRFTYWEVARTQVEKSIGLRRRKSGLQTWFCHSVTFWPLVSSWTVMERERQLPYVVEISPMIAFANHKALYKIISYY